MGILIFKGLIVQRLKKSFGVKGFINVLLFVSVSSFAKLSMGITQNILGRH
jgi:hypothetical protein